MRNEDETFAEFIRRIDESKHREMNRIKAAGSLVILILSMIGFACFYFFG